MVKQFEEVPIGSGDYVVKNPNDYNLMLDQGVNSDTSICAYLSMDTIERLFQQVIPEELIDQVEQHLPPIIFERLDLESFAKSIRVEVDLRSMVTDMFRCCGVDEESGEQLDVDDPDVEWLRSWVNALREQAARIEQILPDL